MTAASMRRQFKTIYQNATDNEDNGRCLTHNIKKRFKKNKLMVD